MFRCPGFDVYSRVNRCILSVFEGLVVIGASGCVLHVCVSVEPRVEVILYIPLLMQNCSILSRVFRSCSFACSSHVTKSIFSVFFPPFHRERGHIKRAWPR